MGGGTVATLKIDRVEMKGGGKYKVGRFGKIGRNSTTKAIRPGVGRNAENADLARACREDKRDCCTNPFAQLSHKPSSGLESACAERLKTLYRNPLGESWRSKTSPRRGKESGGTGSWPPQVDLLI